MWTKQSAFLALFSTLLIYAPGAFAEGITPERLRSEYQQNPIGIDRPHPQLSWIVTAGTGERGKSQSAYRVLVASSRSILAKDIGNLWDTGQVRSPESLHITYRGQQLRSNRQYFWKVQVWDELGNKSGWSEPATWTTGLLNLSDWRAQWITDPDVVVPPEAETRSRLGVNSGYHSAVVRDPGTEKWVGVDLGGEALVDAVKLYPATSFTFQEGSGTVSFPDRYRIELASRPDFSDAVVVAAPSTGDIKPPQVGDEPLTFRFPATRTRYVRIYVTQLSAENELFASFALAEMEVIAKGQNLAKGKPVLAADSLDAPGWSKQFLTDGVSSAVRIKSIRQPASWFRKAFRVDGTVSRATVFATARGVYELTLNGRRIGDHILAPEWTSYRRRSQYQGYDVTAAVRNGDNVIGAVLSHAWYAGRVGLVPTRRVYGLTPELLVHLDVEYTDGRHLIVGTDGSWQRTSDGPIVSADIYDGEIYDARKEMAGWDSPGFSSSGWKPAVVARAAGDAQLNWQSNEPIREHRQLQALSASEPLPGVYVYDLGQNMAGRVRVKISGPAGTAVRIRHAEMLKEDGTLYTDNLRDAWQIDRYIKASDGEEIYEPRFTYHGFRYVELTGLAKPPPPDAVTGIVFYSSAPEVGEFVTSSDLVNKLHSNIIWTLQANMQGIPTDCPQRPERLGWTGDIQAFAQSSIFNKDMASFLRKYLRDMRDDQDGDGRFSDVAPNPFEILPEAASPFPDHRLKGSPGWADAGTVLPWALWVNYGDKQALAEQYDAAKAWVDYVHKNNPGLLWRNKRGLDPGDWLNGDTLILEGWPRQGAAVPLEVHATAFFAHSADLVSRMAVVLGHTDDARRYGDLFNKIKAEFNRNYVQPDGRMLGDTQGGYALALHFNLLPEPARAVALRRIIDLFTKYDGHLSTGFQSTHRLMLELTRAGRSDEGYRVLMMRGFPSWALMIENGATTIWERWDGYVKGRGFQTPGMNSFNHYAFGAVEEWMWRNIIGINPDERRPSYKHFVIQPEVGGGLTWARGTYESIRGRIRTAWKIDGQKFVLSLSVPANTTATVYLPFAKRGRVTESGYPISRAPGVSATMTPGVFDVTSGDYEFTVEGFMQDAASAH